MALLQKERIINFQLLIVVLVAVGMTKSNAPTNISYKCDDSGVISLDIDDLTNYKILTGSNNQGPICSPHEKTLTSCKGIEDKKHLVVVYSEDSKDFVGHASTVYDLVCKDVASEVSKQHTAFKVKSNGVGTVTEKVIIPHSFDLILKINSVAVTDDTDVNIGDELKLQMLGSPSGVVISPLNCTAFVPGDSAHETVIWKYDATQQQDDAKCIAKEVSIMPKTKWEKTGSLGHDLQVSIYAFRFISSAQVVIKCAANVCSSERIPGCTEVCVKDSRRRRREASNDENRQKHMRSSLVSFAISSKEFNDDSSSGLIQGSMKFVIFTLTLVYVYTT